MERSPIQYEAEDRNWLKEDGAVSNTGKTDFDDENIKAMRTKKNAHKERCPWITRFLFRAPREFFPRPPPLKKKNKIIDDALEIQERLPTAKNPKNFHNQKKK